MYSTQSAPSARNRRTVGRREHADGPLAAEHARVDAFLLRVVDHDADEVEPGMADHFAERAAADVAGRPLDDAVTLRAQPAGSASVLSSRNSLRPAAPISRPMPDCL